MELGRSFELANSGASWTGVAEGTVTFGKLLPQRDCGWRCDAVVDPMVEAFHQVSLGGGLNARAGMPNGELTPGLTLRAAFGSYPLWVRSLLHHEADYEIAIEGGPTWASRTGFGFFGAATASWWPFELSLRYDSAPNANEQTLAILVGIELARIWAERPGDDIH